MEEKIDAYQGKIEMEQEMGREKLKEIFVFLVCIIEQFAVC